MKKIFALCGVLAVCGCVRAGSYDVVSIRNLPFEVWSSETISFYDDEPVLVKSEYINEKTFKKGEVLSVYTGYSMLSDKTFRRDIYQQNYVKADKDGVLNSASVPHIIKAGKLQKVIGSVSIDGEEYRLLPAGLGDFVMMIDEEDNLYNRMGQIKGSRLVLLDTIYVPTPEDIRFLPVTKTKVEQTKPVKGFDIKYDGVRMGRVWFTYLDYSKSSGDSGYFENISFPNKPGVVEIKGFGFKILSADNQKLDYIIVKD